MNDKAKKLFFCFCSNFENNITKCSDLEKTDNSLKSIDFP